MTRLYVHAPTPPFPRIAGPIGGTVSRRDWSLSQDSFADVSVSGRDLDEVWIRPGMCWLLDDSNLGERPWAGFVESQQLPLNADSVRVELMGPKRALLSIEMAVRLPVNTSRAYAVKQALDAAQTRHGGIFPGIIDPVEGPAVLLDVRGETISDFIDTLHDEIRGGEWRERVEVIGDGAELRFYLDFGLVQQPTNIILERGDLVEGLITRKRVPGSVAVLGESSGFESREGATTSYESGSSAAEPPTGRTPPLSAVATEVLRERAIGPASVFHQVVISERSAGDIAGLTAQHHEEALRHLDEVLLVVDMTRASTQRIVLGDIIRLVVPDWAAPLNLAVDERLHVIGTTVNAAAGQRELRCLVQRLGADRG